MSFVLSSVIQEFGIPVAITGMLIVFASLVLISTFLSCLPGMLAMVNKVFPESDHAPHGHQKPSAPSGPSPEVVVAIGAALHERRK